MFISEIIHVIIGVDKFIDNKVVNKIENITKEFAKLFLNKKDIECITNNNINICTLTMLKKYYTHRVYLQNIYNVDHKDMGECGVCLEYNVLNKLYNCCHYICKKCIYNMRKTNLFDCPYCRTSFLYDRTKYE